MVLNTFSAAIHITPVVIKTFLAHSKRKGIQFKDGDHEEVATDDIFFDQAFHIVKAFMILGSNNTLESFQSFTNTHVPAPPWSAVIPVQVPLSSCNRAADVLIDWFGPEELESVVGGERWWQVRGLDGIDSEWVTEKEYLPDDTPDIGRKLSESEKTLLKMNELQTVMLYIHGGGYFFGSINTHRYQVIRYARKIKGRCFTVNYRKAPQYPWPCPLQDVLAAYFYLINPPHDALHTPIDPRKIVFAGDSAGGGLCVTALTVLRDMGLPMPAGAVLISPWVDLTHSFPSVMENMPTDIIPPYGFVAKPSPLWPIDPLAPPEGRVIRTTTSPPPKPGHADTLKPDESRSKEKVERLQEAKEGHANMAREEDQAKVESQSQMLASGSDEDTGEQEKDVDTEKQQEHLGHASTSKDASGSEQTQLDPQQHDYGISENDRRSSETKAESINDARSTKSANTDLWEPKPPKVLMKNPEETPLELRSQIQLYATNEQLTHPLVSPVLQGSLGNLCPLYIIAGDGEVLRDEIIYLAHRAAHPQDFPVRHGVFKEGRRQKENAEKYRDPTRVHLQVFDGMCHVLTVFMFTDCAKYAYRSIAQFVKHVTNHSEEHLVQNPFPELHRPPTDESSDDGTHVRRIPRPTKSGMKNQTKQKVSETTRPGADTPTETELYDRNKKMAIKEVKRQQTDEMPNSSGIAEALARVAAGEEDVPNVLMIRERVDIHGHVRPMEPKEEIPALNLKPSEIGVIKEAPCRRWLTGQELWDRRFKHVAEKAIRQKRHNEIKAAELLAHARDQGLRRAEDGSVLHLAGSSSSIATTSTAHGEIETDRRWGPLDLEKENPPPSAICKRRDTLEAIALLRKSIYNSAPVTHRTVPKLKFSDALKAAFDPHDHPTQAPQQSASEQQVKHHLMPVHGLSIWTAIVSLFMRKSSEKARDGGRHVRNTARSMRGRRESSSSQ